MQTICCLMIHQYLNAKLGVVYFSSEECNSNIVFQKPWRKRSNEQVCVCVFKFGIWVLIGRSLSISSQCMTEVLSAVLRSLLDTQPIINTVVLGSL